jgi:hypothetical protein
MWRVFLIITAVLVADLLLIYGAWRRTAESQRTALAERAAMYKTGSASTAKLDEVENRPARIGYESIVCSGTAIFVITLWGIYLAHHVFVRRRIHSAL